MLYKQTNAGSYATITVDPLVMADEIQMADDNTLFSNRAADRIRVDIQNI